MGAQIYMRECVCVSLPSLLVYNRFPGEYELGLLGPQTLCQAAQCFAEPPHIYPSIHPSIHIVIHTTSQTFWCLCYFYFLFFSFVRGCEGVHHTLL